MKVSKEISTTLSLPLSLVKSMISLGIKITSLVFTFDCKIKKKHSQHSNSLDPIHRYGFNVNQLTYIQSHDEFLSLILISLVFTFDYKIKKKLNQHSNSLYPIHSSGFNENDATYIQPHDTKFNINFRFQTHDTKLES